ncbi:hypothetical protein MJH12_09870 [bacterium]|nr:hypothetical protein [bacterium]
MIGNILCFYYMLSFSNAADLHPNLSKTRQRLASGISKIGKMNLGSIMIWAKKDFKRGKYKESLQKARYHMAEDPYDPEPWFLQGLIFERLKKYDSAYLSFKRCYRLKESPRVLRKMKAMLAKFPKKKKKQSLALKDPKVVTSVAKVIPIEDTSITYAKRSYSAFKALETLQSQAHVYQAKKGSLDGFSLKSIKEMKMSTLSIDFSALGEVTIQDGKVFSSVYQNAQFQKEALTNYFTALKLSKEKKYQELGILLETQKDFSKEEFLFLIDIYRRQNLDGKELLLRMKIAELKIFDAANYYWLAEYFYKMGEHQKATHYYNFLNNEDSAYFSLAQYRLKLIQSGGSHKLHEYMKSLRKKRHSQSGE